MERVNDRIIKKVVTENKQVPKTEFVGGPPIAIPGGISQRYYNNNNTHYQKFRDESDKKDSMTNIPAYNVYVETTGSTEDPDKARFNVLRDDFYQ